MEIDQLTFKHNGINYRINPHIWRDHQHRVGLMTVEQVQDTIRYPDFQEDESERIRHFWKWIDDVGSGNYVEKVVNVRMVPRFVITAHPDETLRKGRQKP
jgi:hypothetical protein